MAKSSNGKDKQMETEGMTAERVETCVYCGKETSGHSLVKIYEKYSCDECAYKITGKKKPPKKEDPLRKQYKDLIDKLNI